MHYPNLATLHLLYVEDEAKTRHQMQKVLTPLVARYGEGEDGKAGLAYFREFRPDIVVTDVSMPRMNGLVMSEKLREIDPDCTIMITTAFSDEEYFLKAIEIGIDGYILKPIDPDKMLENLERLAKKIVERKQLVLSQERLQQSNLLAAKIEMVRSLAHHWRQPLTSISFFLDECEERSGIPELSSLARELHGVIAGLSETINIFQGIYSTAANVHPIVLESHLKKVLFTFQDQIEELSVRVTVSCPPDLQIMGVSGELTQLFYALLLNALEIFRERKISQPTLTITAEKADGGVRFSLADNGGGIDEKHLPQIFDPYFSTKSNLNGTGLGLFSVHYLMEHLFRGSITLENRDQGLLVALHFSDGAPQ